MEERLRPASGADATEEEGEWILCISPPPRSLRDPAIAVALRDGTLH